MNDTSYQAVGNDSLTGGLFEGDEGSLTYEQRRAVTALVKSRYVSEVTDPEIWKEIVASEDEIRCTLNNLFLTLTVDKRYEVAYALQAKSESATPFPNTLKASTSLKREETLLVIYLRLLYHRQFASGVTNVFVDREELEAYLEGLRNKNEVDHVSAKKKTENAIDELIARRGYLIAVTGAKDRYRVSPVIPSLFPLERVTELRKRFEALVNGTVESDGFSAEEASDE